jgi:hyperosmotically inducible periplasmic protein
MLTQGMHKKTIVVVAMLLLLGAALRAGADTSDAELTRNIQKQLSNLDYGSRRPVISVASGVVTITGTVASLWLKEETINRTLKVDGIAQLVSELTIPKAESDEKLAMEVIDKITHYDLFTVYDDFQGSVKNGVVHLRGAVTDEKKLGDVIERVAKIRGVQEIDNKVTVLPANQDDDRLRVTIANAIYSLTDFERYSLANPPIHVIVNRGHVTLVGAVRSEIEKRKAYEAARFVNGVLALDDRVVVAKR